MSGLEVSDLRVVFGGLVAVDGVSFDAPRAVITGLIGPNGAGKTTTFNACNGVNQPSSGRIVFDGHDMRSRSPESRAQLGMGRTFQRMELFDSLTVQENVRLGREAGYAGSSIRRQLFAPRHEAQAVALAAEEALDLCGIQELARRAVGSLSTGQRRLVELARVLAGEFTLLLLDEPSSGLDGDETRAFGDVLETVVRERGCGILLVEHDMSLVMRVCTSLYVLDFGKLIFEGSPEEAQVSGAVRAAYLGAAV